MTAFSRSLGHVGDRLDSKGIFRIGSSSDEGDLGEWKVALFLSGRLDSGQEYAWKGWQVDEGWQEAKVGVPLVL